MRELRKSSQRKHHRQRHAYNEVKFKILALLQPCIRILRTRRDRRRAWINTRKCKNPIEQTMQTGLHMEKKRISSTKKPILLR